VPDSIWPTIHAERRALADDLSALTPEQWTTRSLCTEWTVHDVLAHLLSAAKMTPPKFFVRFAAARFDFDRYVQGQAAEEGAGGPATTLAAFRAATDRRSAPPGPKASWLGEAFVHGEDIRRPLGLTRAYPPDQVARAIAFYASGNLIIGGKKRIDGVALTATDTDFHTGSGPLVSGPAIELLLATSGRVAACTELTGPGVAILAARP
jgi:uncharacterized protein (TIGR03083 family)